MVDTAEDANISALVNMSVYRIRESGGKVVFASVSESDSKVRDYRVTGSEVGGKMSRTLGELTLTLPKSADCVGVIFGCDAYYLTTSGNLSKKENTTKPSFQERPKSLLLLSLAAKTPEYLKTIDTMANFLKSFEDPDRLQGADMSMSLKLSTSERDLLESTKKETHNDTMLSSLRNSTEEKIKNMSLDFNEKLSRMELALNSRMSVNDNIFRNTSEKLSTQLEKAVSDANDTRLNLNERLNLILEKLSKITTAHEQSENETSTILENLNKTIEQIKESSTNNDIISTLEAVS